MDLNQIIQDVDISALKKAAERLSNNYRHGNNCMKGRLEKLAYLLFRLPATYAVAKHVLAKIPVSNIKTVLDLGAGPGTASWASINIFPNLEKATLLERDPELIGIGKQLAKSIKNFYWIHQDLENLNFPISDLVIFSYSLGELKSLEPILKKAWESCCQFLVLIEPGTPKGFEKIKLSRDLLISWGAHIIAPCSHNKNCPIKEKDWCHFYKRVERSNLHRYLKEGTLSSEDEKFSYLIVSKTPYTLVGERILRFPQKKSGHTIFTICAENEIPQKVISKRTPELYKATRDLDWGDNLPTFI